MATEPGPIPEKQGTLLWWFLGLLVAGVLILGVGGLLITRYVLRSVEVVRTGEQVEVRTPVGDLRVEKSATPDLGLPTYPGATLAEPAATVELTPPDEEPLEITAARYRTPAAIEEVDAWYREKLGPEFEREGPGVMEKKRKIFGIEIKSDDVVFLSERDGVLRVVALQKKGFQVEIALVRIGHQQGQ